MKRNPGVSLAALALGAALSFGVAGCGGDDATTNPPPAAKELDSPSMGNGATFAHRFFTAGSFPYHCTIHSGMNASVTVDAGAPAADSLKSVAISGNAFAPSTLTIPVGGKVTWTNNDAAPHTVTSD